VNLANNAIGDVGTSAIIIEAIKQSKSLMAVHLYGNLIDAGGIAAIADAIKQSRHHALQLR